MRPVSTSNAAGFPWNSPIPYVFGGLALMLILVAFALTVLACSYYKLRSNASHGAGEVPPMANKVIADMEPKIVVVMAGDENPTFLAKPISSISQ
ncbi:hypothetical protein MRB53_023340 [Persea americana]|uniref:Uncharacterized protein n=1 Tax=Persea americana TaxID=3435 RepID=A0ACC2LA81_PERAE|nr:hypothetical protein MRB53_023340 [Persea americana]